MSLEIVKTRTTRYQVIQAMVGLLTFNEAYRRIRGNNRYKGFSCFNCGKDFEDGEKLGLIITTKGNKVVCRACGLKFKAALEKAEEGEKS